MFLLLENKSVDAREFIKKKQLENAQSNQLSGKDGMWFVDFGNDNGRGSTQITQDQPISEQAVSSAPIKLSSSHGITESLPIHLVRLYIIPAKQTF